MADELYGEELIQFLDGWRAAQQGRDFDERKPISWMRGYRDRCALKASRADEVRTLCTVH